VIFPLWLQTTIGYTASDAGKATAVVGILPVLLAPIVGKNINKVDLRWALTFAFTIFALSSLWASTRTDQASFAQYAWPRFFQGVGIAFFFVPISQVIMSGLKQSEIAAASGLSGFVRTISGSISTAVSTWLWQDRGTYHHAVLAEQVNARSSGWAHYQDQLQAAGISAGHSISYVERVVTQQAMSMAANDMFRLYAVIFIIIIPILWLTKPPFGTTGADGAH